MYTWCVDECMLRYPFHYQHRFHLYTHLFFYLLIHSICHCAYHCHYHYHYHYYCRYHYHYQYHYHYYCIFIIVVILVHMSWLFYFCAFKYLTDHPNSLLSRCIFSTCKLPKSNRLFHAILMPISFQLFSNLEIASIR